MQQTQAEKGSKVDLFLRHGCTDSLEKEPRLWLWNLAEGMSPCWGRGCSGSMVRAANSGLLSSQGLMNDNLADLRGVSNTSGSRGEAESAKGHDGALPRPARRQVILTTDRGL